MSVVYIVYEGNQYLQNLTVKGVYDSEDEARIVIQENHEFDLDEIIEFDEDDPEDRLLTPAQRRFIVEEEIERILENNNNQVTGYDIGYMIEPMELNEWQ